MVYLFLQCMNKQSLVVKITFALHASIFVWKCVHLFCSFSLERIYVERSYVSLFRIFGKLTT